MLLTLVLVACASVPLARAQEAQITLTVQVLTVQRQPLLDVAVKVVDAATNHQLAEGMTDQRGQVRFATMRATAIRVRMSGQLPDGTPLRHTRQDQGGIWVNLPHRDWVMDLRADTDGLIFPDLGLGNAGAPDAGMATAIAEGTLPTVYPTAPVATVVPRTGPRQIGALEVPAPARQAEATPAAPGPTGKGTGMALLLLLLGAIGGVVWVMTRSKI